MIQIWVDGSCDNYKKQKVGSRGAWAALIVEEDGFSRRLCGQKEHTTSFEMELEGVVKVLEHILEPSEIILYTDNEVVTRAFNQGLKEKWESRGYKNSENKKLAHLDLWMRLFEIAAYHDVKFMYTKAHSGKEIHNECDKLSRKIALCHFKRFRKRKKVS